MNELNELYNILLTILDPKLNNNQWIKTLEVKKLKNIQSKINKIDENEEKAIIEKQYLEEYSDINLKNRLEDIFNKSKELYFKIQTYIYHSILQINTNNRYNNRFTHRETFKKISEKSGFIFNNNIIIICSILESNLLSKIKQVHDILSTINTDTYVGSNKERNLLIINSITKDIANRNISESYKNLHDEFYNNLTDDERLIYNQYILISLLYTKINTFFQGMQFTEDKFKNDEDTLLTSLLIDIIPEIIDLRILQFRLQHKIFNDKFIDNISVFIDNMEEENNHNVEEENAKVKLIDDHIIPELVPFLEIEKDIKTLGRLIGIRKYIKENDQNSVWYEKLDNTPIHDNTHESLSHVMKYTTESKARQVLDKIKKSSTSNKYDKTTSLNNIPGFVENLKKNHMYF